MGVVARIRLLPSVIPASTRGVGGGEATRAPELVEAVLDGWVPKGVRLEDLVRPLPSGWAEQRRVLFDTDEG